MVREYAEELLDVQEANSDTADPVDYFEEPYASLMDGCDNETIVPWFLGMGFDPLSYYVEILTAVTFTADVFDEIFPELAPKNAEGLVVRGHGARGLPFTQDEVRATLSDPLLAPAAAAALSLTWLIAGSF